MSSKLALLAIGAYRRWLSPIKGWKCASGALHGGQTCSGAGLRIFKRAGIFKGMALLRRQFDACAIAAHELGLARAAEAPVSALSFEGSYLGSKALGARRAGPRRPMRGQAGFVDCDLSGCDGCDAPSCDLPDVPTCDMPSCELPSCDLPRLPSCGAADCSGCGDSMSGAACDGLEIAYCMDCGPASRSGGCLPSCRPCSGRGTAQERAEKARMRQARAQAERDARRGEGV